MTTRDEIMKGFARKRGLQFQHRTTFAIVELVPNYVEPEGAHVSLYADLGSAVLGDWVLHETELDPETPPEPEVYVGDAVRHWQRIDDLVHRLTVAGIGGADEVEGVPAGWLAVMERVVDGLIARLALDTGDARLKITQIKEKWAELRVYTSVRGNVELTDDLRRIAQWGTAASEGRCMVSGQAGTVDDHPWRRVLSAEMQSLGTQDPDRFHELLYPSRP